jgi:histidyl-tRNA synthetase
MTKISTESYKGVRDFYPEDKFLQKYIFSVMRKTAESFGYVEYDASILEPAELYRAKSGEEIVNDQTYTFKDRGDREVTLRPEMTPTVARMVAGRQNELAFPVRWYSIPNLFRYEKPQRGRLREHWQLNVDMFGASGITADAEIINISYTMLKNFGAKDEDFVIKINSRKILNDIFSKFNLSEDQIYKVTKLLDKKKKIEENVFNDNLLEIVGGEWQSLERLLSSSERIVENVETESVKELIQLIELLSTYNIKNVEFDPTITRGFDYYTGLVFEVFDTSPENNRSMFGGGRYDDLLDMFDTRKIPTVGFGMGDVTALDFLETHDLIPKYKSSTDVYICIVQKEFESNAVALASALRSEGVNVAVDLGSKKVGDQIKSADKQKIPFIIAVGENEVKSDVYTLKELETGIESKLNIDEIAKKLKM